MRWPLRVALPVRTLSSSGHAGVDGLGPLPDQKLPDPKNHGGALRLHALHRHKAHRRPHRRFADCLGIGCIVLPTLHEGLNVGWRDQPNVMAQPADLTTPEMSADAGLHRHDAAGSWPKNSST